MAEVAGANGGDDVGGPARLYKVYKPRRPWEVVTLSHFAGAKVASYQCREPETPALPTYLFYCQDGGCDARQVKVKCKHYDGVPEKPPAMRCPLCGGPLQHLGYVEYETLLPHEDA